MQEPSRMAHKGTIVFFSMDALGHIHPILSIVAELKKRQYRAIILTTRPLKAAKRLQAMGIEVSHCQNPPTAENGNNDKSKSQNSEDALRAVMKPMVDSFRRDIAEAYEGCYALDGAVGKHLDDMMKNHDIIEAKLRSLEPDVVVYDHVIGLPCVVSVPKRWARVYSGFPSALHSALNNNYSAGLGLRPSESTREWKEFELRVKGAIRQKIRDFWRAKGGHDWPLELDLTPTSPHLNFFFGPRELALDPDLGSLPDTWIRLEHTIAVPSGHGHQDGGKQELEEQFVMPQKLLACGGKLIYFSLGTLVTCDTELINRLLSILSKSPNRFVVSMGQMSEHIRLYDNMWGEAFIDQQAILKRADLFITHGGHNSVIEAFYHGVPGLIVLPVFADQFDCAQRVHDCGFGLRLNPFHCTEEALLSAIEDTLADGNLRERMRAVSSRLRSIKYHESAADRLEQLVADCCDGCGPPTSSNGASCS